MSMSKTKKVLASGLAAVTLGGAAIVSSAPAEAGYYGHRYGGYGGYYGGGYRHAGYYGYRPYYRRGYGGGAVAAGLIGGLAVGAIAASASQGYGYGYPAYGYGQPVAYGYPAYSSECYVVRRKFVNQWGDLVIRREQVCE